MIRYILIALTAIAIFIGCAIALSTTGLVLSLLTGVSGGLLLLAAIVASLAFAWYISDKLRQK